ncbi:MAG TPA: nucleoside phosphorylase [Chitinophagaceae bacterium]|jgi:uridine phosphorylase|nr:nucleoside phosphorylase [Chitinophagaceae bacterium]
MQRIAESELILNSRGAIYHLDLLPEELADTIITVGDPFRVAEVSNFFDVVEVRRHHREFVTHTGVMAGKRISVVSTGIGTDNIDIVFNELDALVNIDLASRYIKSELKALNIIRVGTSGSLQADIEVDQFVASSHAIGMDNLLNYYRLENNDEEKQLLQSFLASTHLHAHAGHPYVCTGSASLLKLFVKGFQLGVTVTCPGFYGPQGRILRLGLKNPELINSLTSFRFGQHRITNFEMETSGMYGMARLLGHNCVSLNAIVANRIHKEFSKNTTLLMRNMIWTVLETITSQ